MDNDVPPRHPSPRPASLSTGARVDRNTDATEATVFSGTGNDVIELDTQAVGPQVVVATNTGPGNFTVHTLNAAQEEVAVVVDVVGPTTGRYFTTDDFRFLRIESQGDWTIETVPAALADIPLWVEGAYTGSGNDVVRYTGEPGLLSYSDADDPNIAVRSHGSDTGAMFIAVLADGTWTLTIEPVPAPAPVNPEDRLEAWPPAPAAPGPGDDIPRFLPTTPITVAGTPVRAQADGGPSPPPPRVLPPPPHPPPPSRPPPSPPLGLPPARAGVRLCLAPRGPVSAPPAPPSPPAVFHPPLSGVRTLPPPPRPNHQHSLPPSTASTSTESTAGSTPTTADARSCGHQMGPTSSSSASWTPASTCSMSLRA